jgi:4'-phosphopantetheinyl transferase
MSTISAVYVPEFIHSDVTDFFLSKVSPEKTKRIARFVHNADRYRSLLGEVLIRSIVIEQTGASNDDIRFVYNHYGKPSLEHNPGFSFNLSHSGDWVVLLWDKGGPALGIDVEQIVPIDLGIAECCFTPRENAELRSRTGRERLDYFYRLWTLKESFVKASGRGLSMPLDAFSMIYSDRLGWFSPDAESFHFTCFLLDPMHILSACSSHGPVPVEVSSTSLEALYDILNK